METVIRPVQPMHGPGRVQPADDEFHQILSAKTVARAVEAQDRNGDPLQVSVAQFLWLAGRMKRISQQEKPVTAVAFSRQHRSRPSAHRATSDQKDRRPDFAARPLDHGRKARLKTGHRIRAAAPALTIKEVETNRGQADPLQSLGDLDHAVIGHMSTGAVSANKERPGRPRSGGLEESRRLVGSHLHFPLALMSEVRHG